MQRVSVLGIDVDNITLSEALHKAEEIIRAGKPDYMTFLNINQIICCKENKDLLHFYQHSKLVIVDGTNVTRLAKFLKISISERIYGNDFIYEICQMAAENGFSVFFLGGSPNGAEMAVKNIKKINPQLQVAGVYAPPYGFENDEIEIKKINNLLKESKADLVFVGLGSPKQDDFIQNNKELYKIPLSIPIGSGIDIIGGIYKRAPKWISNIGLEWLYRCFQEPKRLFKRYIIGGLKISKYYWRFKRKKMQ